MGEAKRKLNKRGFLASLAAMFAAPFAAKAADIDGRRAEALRLSNEARILQYEWINGEWREDIATPYHGEAASWHEKCAAQDRATIDRYILWSGTDRTHITALGHWDNGDVWVNTLTKSHVRDDGRSQTEAQP